MRTRSRIFDGDGDDRHGTQNGYSNLSCRCQLCRDAWAAAGREWRIRRAAALPAADPRHGRYTTYQNHACRCSRCHAAKMARRRLERAS